MPAHSSVWLGPFVAPATENALEAYAEVATLSGTAVGGVPADLLARWARCDLLESLQRRDELRREALALHTDLIQGRWHLDRATYQLHAEDVGRWTGTDVTATAAHGHLELASAVDTLWNDWRRLAPDRRAGAGRRVVDTAKTPITVVWAGTPARLSALLRAAVSAPHRRHTSERILEPSSTCPCERTECQLF